MTGVNGAAALSQDDVLLSESSHFTFVYDDPEYSLVVLNALPEHSGVFTCTAKNLAGSNSCKAEFTVHTGLHTHTLTHPPLNASKVKVFRNTVVFPVQFCLGNKKFQFI